MSKFNIELSSVPDRENLVAEIWYENKMVAEVNKETEKFVIEFCLDEKISFMLDEFLEDLKMQKEEYLKDNASLMLQIGSYCNNHLIINVVCFLRLGVKAGKVSLPFAILRKKIMSQQKSLWNFMLLDCKLSLIVHITTQTMLSKVVKVVR